jgi:predicted Zn finger-like uncharacterized protein
MPAVIQCPKCSRQLNVLEAHLGALVRCPVCKTEFTAKALGAPAAIPVAALAPAMPPAARPAPLPAIPTPTAAAPTMPATPAPALPAAPAPAFPSAPGQVFSASTPVAQGAVPAGVSVGDDPFWEAEPPPAATARGQIYHSEFDEDERVTQSTGRPHRGPLVFLLGVASLVTACFFPAGWIIGGIALTMATTDLQDMSRGRVDRSGRQQTELGRLLAVIAVILATVACIFFLLFLISKARV